ncbi:MAG: hypothetical protein A2521_09855 [Deltaproteobacteria bacterium RIFOXYD12_FULL_57_12]|nr:MAG: hypothetical protein A2521_09855 [Deltaproteobacteria bacterium RIFOXYD12_FULL_57_12]
MFRVGFIRGIVFVSLAAVLLLPAYTVFYLHPAFLRIILEDSERDAERAAEHLIEMLQLQQSVLTRESLPANLLAHDEDIRKQFDLLKIRLFLPSGEILYSSVQDETGEINRHDYFQETVAQGRRYSKIVRQGGATLEGQPVVVDLVESCVPIMRDGVFLGAVEIFKDITARKARLDQLTGRIKVTLLPLALIMLLAVVVASLRATRHLANRTRAEEEALTVYESRFRELVHNMSCGVAVYEASAHGRDFVFLDFNRAAEGIEKIGREEVLARSVLEVYPGLKDCGLFDVFRRVWRTGRAEHHPAAFYRDDRREGWRETYVCKLSTGELVAITNDVTERENAELTLRRVQEELERRVEERTAELQSTVEQLKKSYSFNKTVLDSLNDAVSIIDTRDFRIVGANRVFLTDYGLEEKEVIGRRCYEITHNIGQPCAPPDDPCPLKETLEAGGHAAVEHVHYRANGEKIYVEVSTSPICEEDGSVNQVAHVARDITARKEAEQKLEKARQAAEAANLAKSEFLAKVSHELRTPLNGIIGFAELIRYSSSVPADCNYAGLILSESDMLRSIIDEVLDHAKIESGKIILEVLPFDLVELVGRVAEPMKMQADKKGLAFSWAMSPAIPTRVNGDPTRLRQILINLLGNAIKFTEHGSVSLAGELRQDLDDRVEVCFTIVDTGIGIAADKQAVIFDSFVQADGSMTRRYGGSGLGTTIAKHLVELLGGEIGFESEIGRGSTFWFTVVLEKRYVQEQAVTDRQIAAKDVTKDRHGRILVVEDYFANQEVARRHLETAGYQVDLAENGRIAVQMAAASSYDLILMDVQMPEMDGYEATGRIRQSGRPGAAALPILAMTANAGAMDQQKCLDAGMNDVIIKPIRRQTFLETVDGWLSRPSEPSGLSGASLGREALSAAVSEIPIDLDQALDEFAGDRGFLAHVVTGFLTNAVEQIGRLRAALDKGDAETVRKEAHAIKGGAANLVARPLAAAAKELEDLARGGKTGALAAAIIKVENEVFRLRDYWQARSTEQG